MLKIKVDDIVSIWTGLVLSKSGFAYTVKPVLCGHSKGRPKITFQDQLSLNAGQKELQNAPRENSEILSTFIKLQFVIKILVLSIFEWPLKTGITVLQISLFKEARNMGESSKFPKS